MVAASLAALAIAAGPGPAAGSPAQLQAIAGVPVDCLPAPAYNAAIGEWAGQRWLYGVAGFYSWQGGRIGLIASTCRLLGLVRLGQLDIDQAVAVHALGHEMGHAAGIVDEHAADCYGAGIIAPIAWQLGLRGRLNFWILRVLVGDYAGYSPIPASCFRR